MRGLAAWFALAGCGRIAFEPIGVGPDVGYFISPSGSDAYAGTRAAPWLSFAHALAQLAPGDRLTLLDGDYDAMGPTGRLAIDCTNLANGTATAPIVVRADHPRRAHLFDSAQPLEIRDCMYWQIEDLWLEGFDDPANPGLELASVHYAGFITVRGLLLHRVNRHGNNLALEVIHVNNVLVEDCEAYDFHRTAYGMSDATAATFRRLYANGRATPDIPGYSSSCNPGGDNGVESYYASGGIIEDTIIENTCYHGFSIVAGRGMSGSTGLGDEHVLVGDIALQTRVGFHIESDCDASAPCDSPDRICSNNIVRDSASIDAPFGFELSGIDNAIENVTGTSTSPGGSTVLLDVTDPGGGLLSTGFVRSTLVVGGDFGIRSVNQADWGVTASNVFAAAIAFSPNDSHVTSSTTVDPQLGACRAYLPDQSPLRTAGPSGTPIGADIRTQYADGAMTTTPMWRADGTFAGCGAVVAGVNDDPATSCIGVHTRLAVGVPGCPLP